ncbi:hypothetical protein B446_15785 [Streptomyces collinus Tu 365]|uniref:Uncharacterized protein n=1 Tax=Streptomyces collinus (strain DSM 40733 / Tue 365) TaxID=1214242 RepID=S5VNR7_STRC3|nr:hypothetical protein B446_15785 [Streptomyces collinus Tu 365]
MISGHRDRQVTECPGERLHAGAFAAVGGRVGEARGAYGGSDGGIRTPISRDTARPSKAPSHGLHTLTGRNE